MVTVGEAATVAGVKATTVRSWLRKGSISVSGNLRWRSGGGFRAVMLVERHGVEECAGPPDGGLPVYCEVPRGAATISEAATLVGVTEATVRGWVKKGQVTRVGFLRWGAVGGARHRVLLDRAAVTGKATWGP